MTSASPKTKTRLDVGAVEDFPERSVTLITIGRREVGVVRWSGTEIYALHNRCPHQGGPLCRGALTPMLVSREGEQRSLEVVDKPIMACAWHRWEFDVATGCALWDANYRVRTYDVDVVNGRVLVDVTRRGGVPAPGAGS